VRAAAVVFLALLHGAASRQAWFHAPSYRPGQPAILHVAGPRAPLRLQVFQAGGDAVTPSMPLRVKVATLRIGAWPSRGAGRRTHR
jgi:hypothetical protein